MRVLVTGTAGQVARALARAGPRRGAQVIPCGRPELDLEAPDSIAPAIGAARPDIVINAAAFTAVDRAEAEEPKALAVNGQGAGAVARAARLLRLPIVQLSTDYVFDGRGDTPFRESDHTGPVNAYGRTKLEGERQVAAANPDHAIIRLAWLYSPFGGNFVRTMLRLAATRGTISVVADQHGSPSSALDVADGLLAICRNLLENPADSQLRGVFHMAGGGYASWAELAAFTFAVSKSLGGPYAEVIPVTSAQFPSPARRPLNSSLNCSTLLERHGVRLPEWRLSVEAIVAELVHNELQGAT